MTNAGHIVIPSDKRVPKEQHLHHCPMPWCKRMVMEDNAVCGKLLAGTGLESHPFPCLPHLHAWRTQWGIDDLLDTVLDPNQARRMVKEWPDAKVEQREKVEIARGNVDLKEVHREPE